MGVWERSPAGLRRARRHRGLRACFRAALPDLSDADVVGSPYCVRRYARRRRASAARTRWPRRAPSWRRAGSRLILDYVPNHVAPDHPWATRASGVVRPRRRGGSRRAIRRLFVRTAGGRARQRPDPYFPPGRTSCSSTRSRPGCATPRSRRWRRSAAQCDGVRCDMAMLMTNEVFARTWGERAGPAPAAEFWPAVIAARAARRTRTSLFIAEAYWDMEWTLQQQGFDFCYDKRLYDRLVREDARSRCASTCRPTPTTRSGWCGSWRTTTSRAPRDTFAPDRRAPPRSSWRRCAGARLWHDGQFEGAARRSCRCSSARGPRRAAGPRPARVLRPAAAPRWPAGPARRRLAAARLHGLARQPDAPSSSSRGAGDAGGQRHLVVVNLAGAGRAGAGAAAVERPRRASVAAARRAERRRVRARRRRAAVGGPVRRDERRGSPTSSSSRPDGRRGAERRGHSSKKNSSMQRRK